MYSTNFNPKNNPQVNALPANSEAEKQIYGEYEYDPNARTYKSRTTGELLDQTQMNTRIQVQRAAGAKAEEMAALAAQGLNPDGSPKRPEYESWLDPATGLMKDQYQITPELLDSGTLAGFQALQKRVLTPGQSEWAKLMTQNQQLAEAQQKDAAAKQTLSAGAQARSQLAMRGGMSSGARERLAMGGSRDLMLQRQNVASQGQQARMGINIEDEAQRMKLLPGFAEGEAKLSEYNLGLKNRAEESNIRAALEEKRAKDSQDLAVYQEQIKKWAAEKEAAATRSGGGGGK